jgi:hypothetical protein
MLHAAWSLSQLHAAWSMQHAPCSMELGPLHVILQAQQPTAWQQAAAVFLTTAQTESALQDSYKHFDLCVTDHSTDSGSAAGQLQHCT